MLSSLFLASSTLTAIAAASPIDPPPSKADVTTTAASACSSVSSMILNGPATSTPTIPAGIAYECLTSVPLNKTAALELLDSVKPYITWQSTTSYLKNPPADYVAKVQPAVDVWQNVADLEEMVNNDTFTGEYEFGWAVYRLFQTPHDGHFVYVPDSVGSIFTWGRTVPLVSVSEDGQKLPAIFAYPDVLRAAGPDSTFIPSAIVKINGEEVTSYLENWSRFGSLQDPDALYNNVFYELAQIQLGSTGSATGTFTGGGRGRWAYPGAETKFEFANGTTKTYENFARSLVSFRGVENGTALAKRYFYYEGSTASAAVAAAANAAKQDVAAPAGNDVTGADVAATTTANSRPTAAPGYPEPVVYQRNNYIAGYYLEGEDYSDVAVLTVPSFVSLSSAEKSFQEVGTKFLAMAKAAGKKKLIIDLSANGGGTILQGYDLFKQLFPSILPYGGSRFRAHETLDLLGQKFSQLSEGFPRELSIVEENYTMADIVSSAFNYRTDTNADYKPFSSWAEKYGPHKYNGDEFSSIIRWNLSDPLNLLNSGGIEVTGFGNRTNYTTQPFESPDVVMLFDGYCASTCTIFYELMRQQANVTSIALGGRPQYGQIQAVGGTKGTNNFGWAALQVWVQTAFKYATDEEKEKYNSSYQNTYASYTPFNRAASTSNVNVRDGIRKDDETGTPLQFIYEPADCRIFYTAEMTLDASAIWKAAADSKWGDKSHCIDSSNGNAKRDETISKRAVVPKMKKRDLELERALELYTDYSQLRLDGDGFMFP
ncbi:uncharacterized protein K452DRAFT_105588 [Aplosporella prunicola CBS 121167]|uniref:Uncharacterized protein n=1 Tax=Aplosporella prunicola CBS 121167 TaxID=1176127 RepID=A0A6A6BTY7_9PEZI|nr:uncharacterized protein K452DRAFT_105588 [Aplosporella prunicola CBS 121167]KAF2146091.1 hypothetical protein K452DRAFT_105588 [Aplosporella prunicola CBS 121167]